MGDAARVLGCGPPAVAGRVHLPLLRPSLISAVLLVLVDVMKELPATLILRPFNFDTLAVEAFQLATTERLDGAALPSLVIVAVGLVPVVLLCRMLDRGRASATRELADGQPQPRGLAAPRRAAAELLPAAPVGDHRRLGAVLGVERSGSAGPA